MQEGHSVFVARMKNLVGQFMCFFQITLQLHIVSENLVQVRPCQISGWTMDFNTIFFIIKLRKNEASGILKIISHILDEMRCVKEQIDIFVWIRRMLYEKLVTFSKFLLEGFECINIRVVIVSNNPADSKTSLS